MSKNVLEQYVFIKKEIADLKKRIAECNKKIRQLEKEIVCDAVIGSRKDLTIGTIKIQGIAETEITRQWDRIREYTIKIQTFKEQLEKMVVEVEDFIQQISNSEIRCILRFRFTDGLEWQEVAKNMGAGYTGECCRQKVNRYLEKHMV